MEAESFTEEEKKIIAQMIQKMPGKAAFLFEYLAYVVPSVLFAIYGLWKGDFIAVAVAYAALLIVALAYLNYTHRYVGPLYSAIKKYETCVGALSKKPEPEVRN